MVRMINRIKEDLSYKVTLFFALVIAWNLVVQIFLNIHSDLFQFVVLLLPTMLFLVVDKGIRNNIKKQFKRLPFKTILIIPLIWICFLPFKLVMTYIVTSFIGPEIVASITETSKSPAWYLLLTSAVTPAICEELLLRGIVYNGYPKYNIHVIAIMNGLLFGIMHLNIYQFSYTFFSGIVMTYLVHITGSIFASMLMHFINNGIAYIPDAISELFGSPEIVNEGIEKSSDSLSFTFTEYGITLIIIVIGLICIYKLFKKLVKIHNVDTAQFKMAHIYEFNWKEVMSWPLSFLTIVFLGANAVIMIALSL